MYSSGIRDLPATSPESPCREACSNNASFVAPCAMRDAETIEIQQETRQINCNSVNVFSTKKNVPVLRPVGTKRCIVQLRNGKMSGGCCAKSGNVLQKKKTASVTSVVAERFLTLAATR